MWLSICEKFTEHDDAWENYINWIRLHHLHEIKTIDISLNRQLSGYKNIQTMEYLVVKLLQLPDYDQEKYYLRLAINCSDEEIPILSGFAFNLLGYDLSDETCVSSILNCGPWKGDLLPFTDRINSFGLLTYEDALKVQEILPEVWDDDPHSFVDIWAVFEIIKK